MFPAKAPLEDSHPLIWKDSKPVTDNHFGVWILILPLAIGIWYLCLCAELVTHGDTKLLYDYPFRFGSLIIGTALIVISAYIAMAHRAALSIAKEKDQQTWLILLTTPMTAREILWSKMVITWQPLAFGLMIIGPAWLLGILTGAVGIFSLLATIGIIISHALLLSAWGLWQSLRQPSRRQAIIHTFAWAGVTMGGIQLLLYCLHPYSPFTDILFGTVPILAVGLPLFTSFDNSIHWAVCSAVASALVAAIVGLTLTYQTYRQFPVLTERVE